MQAKLNFLLATFMIDRLRLSNSEGALGGGPCSVTCRLCLQRTNKGCAALEDRGRSSPPSPILNNFNLSLFLPI